MKDYSHVQNQSNQGNNKRGSKFQNVSKLQLIFGLIVLIEKNGMSIIKVNLKRLR